MRKSLIKHKYLDLIYGAKVEVFQGPPEESLKYINSQWGLTWTLEDFRNCSGKQFEVEYGGKWRHFIWLAPGADWLTTLHEVYHLVATILIDRGIPFLVDNHEAYAYYYEYWVQRIFRHFHPKFLFKNVKRRRPNGSSTKIFNSRGNA